MIKKIKVCFIGGGADSEIGMTHYRSILMTGLFEVSSGFFSKIRKTNLRSANLYGVKRNNVYFSIKELIKSRNFDIVILLTPIVKRLKILKTLLKNNIPTVCEKPLLANYSEVKKISNVNEKNFLFTTYNYSGYPILRELKYMIEKKKFGSIKHIKIEMPSQAYVKKNVIIKKWRLKKHNPPFLYLDLGAHVVNLLLFLTEKKVSKVIAHNSCHGKFSGIVDDCRGIIELENKSICSFWFGKSSLGHDNGLRIEIFGKKSSAIWEQINPENIKIFYEDGYSTTMNRSNPYAKISNLKKYNIFKPGHPIGYLESFHNYYQNIYFSYLLFKNKKNFSSNYLFNFKHSAEILNILEYINLSARKRKWINVKK